MPPPELRPPDDLPAPGPAVMVENLKLAREFAQPGTVMHFAFRMGYMPANEEKAEAILRRCLREGEWWEQKARDLAQELEWEKRRTAGSDGEGR